MLVRYSNKLLASFLRRYLARSGIVGHVSNINMALWKTLSSLKSGCVKHFQQVCFQLQVLIILLVSSFTLDTAIKRFAYRHTYLHIDSIASGDLGVVTSRHVLSSSGSGASSGSSGSSILGRTDTQLLTNSASFTSIGDNSQSHNSAVSKRPSSPDRGRRDDSAVPHKRTRVSSPPRDRDRDRDRDRWDSSSKGRRYGSPVRDRDRPRSPPRRVERDREESEKPPPVPQVLSWFLGSLPPASSFDGTVLPA